MEKINKVDYAGIPEDIYGKFGNDEFYPLADWLRDLYELSWQKESKINEIVEWINEHDQAGGEHDPDRKCQYIRKVTRIIQQIFKYRGLNENSVFWWR